MSGDHHGPEASVAARVRHLEAALEARGLIDPLELDRAITAFVARASPANGGRLAARAWLDPGFRERLLADANAALPELELSMGGGLQDQRLKVVENTEQVHNVIVCTLCSCYPIALLGPSPTWYKSESYRARSCASPARSSRSSASRSTRRSRSPCGTPARRAATWSSPGGRPERTTSTRPPSPRSSPATA